MVERLPMGRSLKLLVLSVLVFAALIGQWSEPEAVGRVARIPWVGWLGAVAAGALAAWLWSAKTSRAQSLVAIAVLTSGLMATIVEHLCLAQADPGSWFVVVAPLGYLTFVVPLNWWVLRASDYRGATLASLLSGLFFLTGLVALCRYVEMAGPFDWTI